MALLRSKIAGLVFLLLMLPAAPALAQGHLLLTFLETALKSMISRLVEKGVDAVWSTPNPEVQELKVEMERIRRMIEHMAQQQSHKATPGGCPADKAETYLRCIVDGIKRARAAGRIDDKQARELARDLLDVTASAERRTLPSSTGQPTSEIWRTDSRQIGPDTFCSRTAHPNGFTSVGIIQGNNRVGDWIELPSGLDTASLVTYRNGTVHSRKQLAGKMLRPDRKHEFSKRVLFSSLGGPAKLANGYGANVYYSAQRNKRVTLYFGSYVGGRRHGPGCYFGTLTVFPYCYRRDLRIRVSHRNGYADLSHCTP